MRNPNSTKQSHRSQEFMPQLEEANRVLEKAKASADESANRISDLERKTQSDDFSDSTANSQ